MTWSTTLCVVYLILVHGFTGGSGGFTLGVSCAPVGLFQNMQTSTVYTTPQEALDDAKPGETTVLLGNVYDAYVNVTNSVIIDPDGFTLTIPSRELMIPSGNSLKWLPGNLIIEPGGNILNYGTLCNNEVITKKVVVR